MPRLLPYDALCTYIYSNFNTDLKKIRLPSSEISDKTFAGSESVNPGYSDKYALGVTLAIILGRFTPAMSARFMFCERLVNDSINWEEAKKQSMNFTGSTLNNSPLGIHIDTTAAAGNATRTANAKEASELLRFVRKNGTNIYELQSGKQGIPSKLIYKVSQEFHEDNVLQSYTTVHTALITYPPLKP